MKDFIQQKIVYFLSYSFQGVNHSIPGNGGIHCYDFLTTNQRILDTTTFTVFACLLILPRVLKTISLPKELGIRSSCIKRTSREIIGSRRFLLIALCLVFGVEIGFKVMKDTWIYLLNPCHLITAIQIYLLSAEPSRACTAVFRVHIHLLFGGFLATIFPVTNTRSGIGEQISYWVQHIAITLIVPPYLIRTGGAYRCEPIRDFSWALLTILIFGFYMYYILQTIGMLTLVNLNSMLCPAITDPFYGPNYRWYAMVHQQLLIIVVGKVYTFIIHRVFGVPNDLPPEPPLEESPMNNNNDGQFSSYERNKVK